MKNESFKLLFGYYRIKSERKLKKAAAEGGYKWELAKDVTVRADVTVTAARALMIDGKGHSITGTNCDGHAQIFDVAGHADLYIKNVRMINANGSCIRVNADAKLCVDACSLQSAGDGIINYAKTWVYGGTTMKAANPGAVCIRNLNAGETQYGEVTLYKCTIESLYNEGVLTLTQKDSHVCGAVATEDSKVFRIDGRIETLTAAAKSKDTKKYAESKIRRLDTKTEEGMFS